MKEAGLCSIRTNAKADYLRLNASEFPKNQIQQKFKTQAPNQVWVSDVTCFKVKDKYFYICVPSLATLSPVVIIPAVVHILANRRLKKPVSRLDTDKK